VGFRGAHSHYDDPAYYSYAYRSRKVDVRYYASLVSSTCRVLEYGVGNGRVALALARAGAEVTGIDSSAPMLADLASKLGRRTKPVRERIRVVRGDMRRVDLAQRFDLVIAPFNTVQHLHTSGDFRRFLAKVRRHLAADGEFVFDFSLPRPRDLAPPSGPEPVRVFRHPRLGCRVRYVESFRYDPIAQLLSTTMYFAPLDGGRPFRTMLRQRQWFPREVEALLHYSGFEKTRLLADFDPSASFDGVDTVVVRTRPTTAGKSARNRGSHPKSEVQTPLHVPQGVLTLARDGA